MPNKDGTGPDGNGPKSKDQGTPTPKRDGSCKRQRLNKRKNRCRRS